MAHYKPLQHILVLFGLLLLPWMVSASDENPAEEVAYYRLYPNLMTNLQQTDKNHFIQIQVEVMTANKTDADSVKYHEPLIRDRLIALLNGKSKRQMRTMDGRKKFQQEALQIVKDIMVAETGTAQIKQVLFTKIIIE
jgi:flagellar protein FliL